MADHGSKHYVNIWGILLVLLVISIFGPFLEIQAVTLITAFGIAFVKAYLVVKHFMHLNVQPAFVGYILATCLVFMLLLFTGAAPDVMKKDGDNWMKPMVVVVGTGGDHGAGHDTGHEAGGHEPDHATH